VLSRKQLKRRIAALQLLFSRRARTVTWIERQAMINLEHGPSLTRQAELLDLSRTSLLSGPWRPVRRISS
jgi:hypothetical protein